ncbi:hypothetical protein HK096_010406 [Nowakowskiella sp. JEL0078]|nr:hypothetical protein HK096_010406 [Nowakowskiella sp. JEL0078]
MSRKRTTTVSTSFAVNPLSLASSAVPPSASSVLLQPPTPSAVLQTEKSLLSLNSSSDDDALLLSTRASLKMLDSFVSELTPLFADINTRSASLASTPALNLADDFTVDAASKLLDLHSQTLEKVVAEQAAIQKALEQVVLLKAMKEHDIEREVGKRKKRKQDEKQKPAPTPKKSKVIQSTAQKSTEEAPKPPPQPILEPGDQVAVRPANQDWILAYIMNWIPEKGKYEVEDAEDDEVEVGKRKRYLFTPRMIIPIPTVKRAELPIGREVLALYPNSSCFYKAEVILPPSKVWSF